MDLLRNWLVPSLWAAWFAAWYVLALRARRGTRLESLRSRVVHFSLLGSAAVLLFVPGFSRGPLGWRVLPGGPGTFLAGVAILVTGLAFTVWARVHLGRYWSGALTLKKGHRLIRTGPYELVRHPIYSGLIAALVGTAVSLGELRGALALVLAAAAYLRKIGIEERALAREFGDEHARYREQVRLLVPFIL
jgi:protein-S-isoprenylcysteine O-methyltransferase Ste14